MGEKDVFFKSDSTDGATHWLKMPADGMTSYCSVNFIAAALQGWFVAWLLICITSVVTCGRTGWS